MTVVFDLDGTTIFKGKKMSKDIEQAIAKLSKQRKIIFASARPIRDMLPVLPPSFHDFTLIGGNGAFIKNKGLITATSFSEKETTIILKLIEINQLDYMVDSSWDYSFRGDSNHPLFLGVDPLKTAKNKELSSLYPIIKAVLFTTEPQIIQQLKKLQITIYLHGSEQLIDLSPKEISKWTAFKSLYFNEPFIMFGNDANDLPMFEHASKSYIIGNTIENTFKGISITEESVARTITSLCY
ncbi:MULTISPECIES: HAD-IIB family hydrolase [Vagococcus]|uniref:Hypothetical hydrolase n=1 Tax=Vagococcus fluvialis bH819 TaxID=1255619 RepID=A0A1X6WNN6_9ENTE|nr:MULTISPECIES: HAD-IIB family hydrolase [Vagococcus]SLM85941.1 Hypothetical hydrolase [Vagococcus fluvialis bH819]